MESIRERETYVALGEITTLKHELGDDAVELGAGVTEALLAGAESAEVLGRLGHLRVEEVEDNPASLLLTCGVLVYMKNLTKRVLKPRGSEWENIPPCL